MLITCNILSSVLVPSLAFGSELFGSTDVHMTAAISDVSRIPNFSAAHRTGNTPVITLSKAAMNTGLSKISGCKTNDGIKISSTVLKTRVLRLDGVYEPN
jgi:hypothetical protein